MPPPFVAPATVLTSLEAAIQEGRAFQAQLSFLLTQGGRRDIQATTTDKLVHVMERGLAVEGRAVSIILLEAPNFISGTSAIPIHNANRNSDTQSTITAYSDPTNISGGTVLERNFVLGGGYAIAPTSIITNWILRLQTNYILCVSNEGLSAARVHLRWRWYEETV